MGLILTNTNDIFLRNATISLLDILNTDASFKIIRKGVETEVTVPFFYNFAVSDQFMMDFFFNLPEGCNIPLAEGNYERVPRGVVTLQSVQINTTNLTNKFERGAYVKTEVDENGKKHAVPHSARLFSIPLLISYSIEVIVDTLNESFKIFEKLLNDFYANRVTYFDFGGSRIQAQTRFPDSPEIHKSYKFDFDAVEERQSIRFGVVMETSYPSFDSASDHIRKKVVTQYNSGTINAATGQPLTNFGPFLDQTTPPPLHISPDEGSDI